MKKSNALGLAARILAAGLLASVLSVGMASAEASSRITVGSTTPMTGRFFTDQWGSGAADLDVRALIHGYNLIRWNAKEAMFETDPSVVSGTTVAVNARGDQTFHVSIYQDLKFSDGSGITAKNYVFSLLLSLSPQMQPLGADTGKRSYIQGGDAYAAGTSQVLAGVRLESDYAFSITIDAAHLPYFYELGLLDLVPYPFQEIVPGYTVADTGAGVFFARAEDLSPEEPAPQLLADTLFGEEKGYVQHPGVTSGPYVLESYDGATAEFAKNPYYKGNSEGILPSIDHVTYVTVKNDTMMDALERGEIDLINRAADQLAIEKGRDLVKDSEEFAAISYPRSGLSFISLSAENQPALESTNVRQALAWCLDQQAVCEEAEGAYGSVVHGWYGIGQWMYALEKEAAEALPSYEAEADQALAQARALLEADGWTLNPQGEPFAEGTDQIRCKETSEGTYEGLTFTLAVPEGSRMGELLSRHFGEHLAAVGVGLEIVPVEGTVLLSIYSGQQENPYDMLYLATNFGLVFDPCDLFCQKADGSYSWGISGIADAPLYEAAKQMRSCKSGDVEAYRSAWISFQQRFARELPALPVYSNIYFDFYPANLKDYNPALTTSWGEALSSAWLEDAM